MRERESFSAFPASVLCLHRPSFCAKRNEALKACAPCQTYNISFGQEQGLGLRSTAPSPIGSSAGRHKVLCKLLAVSFCYSQELSCPLPAAGAKKAVRGFCLLSVPPLLLAEPPLLPAEPPLLLARDERAGALVAFG